MKARLQRWLHRRVPAQWLDNRLFIFCALGMVLGLMVMLTSPFSGPTPVIIANLLTGLTLIGVSLAGLMGAPVRPLVHLVLSLATLALVMEASYAGGLFAPAISWMALLPLAPLFLMPLVDAFIWFGISNLVVLGMWWAMHNAWISNQLETDTQLQWYSGINYVLTCLTVLSLPLMSEREFKRNMDINRVREQELLEKRADLLRAQTFKDSFISTLSHELRTPMNAILGFNDLLSVRLKNNPQALELVNLSRQSGEHLLTVINDVLDFSQIQMGQLKIHPEPFDLRTTVHSAFKLFAQRVESMDIDYQLNLAEDLPTTIHSDRHRLMQVLVNLLGNAIKFTHQGQVCLSVMREDADLLFEVSDTGIGVAPDRMAKIFERYEQATLQTASVYGGNGLGLSICHDLVALLGGHIGVDSVLGQGSRFWVRLPLQEATKAAANDAELATAPLWRDAPVRFLIVDDHPVNRLLACHMVQSHWPNAVLRQADNGQQALAILQQEHFDLVLMDMVMPEMDGIEATRYIRDSLPAPMRQVPVVLLTANVNPQDHWRGQQAGINGLMVKPFDRIKLCTLIEEELLGSVSFLQRLAQRVKQP
jgi:signal transduction histidine kinase/AmiR/NasT family two-component response regulator